MGVAVAAERIDAMYGAERAAWRGTRTTPYYRPVGQAHATAHHVHDPKRAKTHNPNEKLAMQIGAGVESWDFDAQQVAAFIVSLDSRHQLRIAQIVFHLIRIWARFGANGPRPGHPMDSVYQQARKAIEQS